MAHNKEYYSNLVMYELKTRKMDFNAWTTITRMVNNPAILANQEILFDKMIEGHYLIKVTEAVMDSMKEEICFENVQRVEDETGKYKEFMKKYYPQWA